MGFQEDGGNMTNVIYKLQDASKTPVTDQLVLMSPQVDYSGDRDIKVFDLGVMSFLIDDILSGYKLPNYVTDFGRQKEKIVVQGEVVESLHTPIVQTIWNYRKFFMLTSYRYRNNYIEIGTHITTDNISSEGAPAGSGPLYCRVKSFNFSISADQVESIRYKLEVWIGKIIRIID
jgi:hypothetical protein